MDKQTKKRLEDIQLCKKVAEMFTAEGDLKMAKRFLDKAKELEKCPNKS